MGGPGAPHDRGSDRCAIVLRTRNLPQMHPVIVPQSGRWTAKKNYRISADERAVISAKNVAPLRRLRGRRLHGQRWLMRCHSHEHHALLDRVRGTDLPVRQLQRSSLWPQVCRCGAAPETISNSTPGDDVAANDLLAAEHKPTK
jgi:hypothetical protein